MLAGIALLAVHIGAGSAEAGPEVWLDKGQVILTLPSGNQVTMEAGNHADCDEDDCELTPLALAPVRPEVLQTLGQIGTQLGGLAPAPLAAGPATTIATIAVPAVGIGSIVAGAAAGLADSTTSTTATIFSTPSSN